MSRRWPVTLLVALWASQLGTQAAARSKVNPRIIAAPRGESRAALAAAGRCGRGCSCQLLPAPGLSTCVSSSGESLVAFIAFVSLGRPLALLKMN